MKIIAHRGASGLALENTEYSIELARLLEVDAIEFDIRITKDQELVLAHDDDIHKVAGVHVRVSETNLQDLQNIKLIDGKSHIPTLEQALKAAQNTKVIIEIKTNNTAELLLKKLKKYNKKNIIVASFKHEEAARIKRLCPELTVYLAEHTQLFEIIDAVKKAKVDGIDFNFWLLNPLTYYLARRNKMEIMAYTLNSKFLVYFIHFLYPEVAICTNHPEWFIKHPWLKLRKTK